MAEEQAKGISDINKEEQTARTEDISTEDQAARTDDISTEEQTAGTDDISTEEQTAGTEDISTEDQAARTDDISTEEQEAGTDDISINEQAAVLTILTVYDRTDNIDTEEQTAGTDDITTEEQAAGTDDITTEEQTAGTDDITTEEHAAGTDDISTDQIHLSLLYVRSEAAEKLSSDNKVNNLRVRLWQKHILCDKEFALLGETGDKEGLVGMSQKLIDLMLEKKNQHHQFLHEIQILDPEVHNLIIGNLDLLQKVSDHIRNTYKERNCHLVQVLPGEQLQLDLHRKEYVMPLVITAEKLVKQERQGHWLPQSEVRHKYKIVEFQNVEQIVNTMLTKKSESVGLCTGIAGVGKTICTKKIITGWVDGEDKLQGYTIVIAIPVRDVNLNGRIIDMIGGEQSSLGLVTNNMKKILDYCLTEQVYASNVLLLVDGIDECDITPSTELYQFITGQKYPHVKKLITARPEASLLADLKSFYFYPDYKVTIHGTSKRGVYRYLQEIMTDDCITPSDVEIDKLISKCQQEMVQFDILLVPLYLTLVGFLFNDHWAQYCTFTNFTVPNTTSKLFSSFMNILVRIWLKKIGRNIEAENINFEINPIGPESNIPKDIKKILIFSFGRISYEFILKQKYTMTQQDLDNYLIEIEHIKQSGMFCMSQERGQMFCFFRHKTLQEFMAALYLSHMQLTEHTFTAAIDSAIQSQKAKTLLQVFSKLYIVVKFLFSLDPELCYKIIEMLSGRISVVKKDGDIDLDYEASLFSEVKDDQLSKAYVDFVAKTKTRIANSNHKPKNEAPVLKLCQAFSPQQIIAVLNNWYNLDMYQQEHEWVVSSLVEKRLSKPSDVLCIKYLPHLLCIVLQKYQFNNIESLTLKYSYTTHMGFFKRIFPKLKVININLLAEKSINDLLISSTSELQHSNETNLVCSGSTNTNLHSIVIKAGGGSLPVSSVESLLQQAGLQSLTLCWLYETPPLWDVASRQHVSWDNLSVLEISVFNLKENEILQFLQKYTPKLTALTISCCDPLNSSFSAVMHCILHLFYS